MQTFGVVAGHKLPENQPIVTGELHREWCKRRAMFLLNAGGLGCLGNAIGQLHADFMRHADTKDLIERLRDITSTEELIVFLEYL